MFGVEDKTGRIEGLSYDEVQSLSSQAGNMAENNIVPTLYIHSYPEEIDGKTVLVVEIPAGSNKPYKTLKGGEIYVKQGADKRLVKENRELMRMFYDCGQYYPDSAGVPGTSIRNLSESLIDRFFETSLASVRKILTYRQKCFMRICPFSMKRTGNTCRIVVLWKYAYMEMSSIQNKSGMFCGQ